MAEKDVSSSSEWSSGPEEEFVCDYEKERLQNIKQNQEILKFLGLPVKQVTGREKPACVKAKEKGRNKRKKKRKHVSSSESDSDEEWQPWMMTLQERQTNRGCKGKRLPPLNLEERLEMLRAVDEEVDQCMEEVMEARKKGSKLIGLKKSQKRKPPAGATRFPLNVRPLPDCFDSDLSEKEDFWGFPLSATKGTVGSDSSIYYSMDQRAKQLFHEEIDNDADFEGFTRKQILESIIPDCHPSHDLRHKDQLNQYREDEVSDEDEYLFCEDCDCLHHGHCPVHGPLKELDPCAGYDKASLVYTQLPVPAEVTIKHSVIPGAGLGVFATRFIPRGVRVGPYHGRRLTMQDRGDLQNTSYLWEVRQGKETPYFIDGQDPTHSNWMRFVNCARHEDEQNMVAFQFHGQIYYRSYKNIYPGTELLVWYGNQYARELGISTESDNHEFRANFHCLGCGATFVEKRSFDIHLNHTVQCASANPQTFSCGRCKQTFSKVTDLQKHIKRHNYQDMKLKENYSRLSNSQSSIKPYKCEHCGKTFNRSSNLQTHLRIHSGDKPYKCEHCGKSFSQSGHLQTHLRIHSGDKPYKCEHCGKSFSRSGHLQNHLRIHSGDKPYKCEHCGKTFNRSSSLQTHLRIHSGDKPYKCEHCGKSFSLSGYLQTHLRIHSGDKPYKCKHCGKTFNQSSSLQTHLRIHSGDKPYKCEHCGKSFNQSSSLQTHLRIHSGDKPYKCEHCGKSFSLSGYLQTHLRIHSGDKPYKCKHCGKTFNQSSSLQTHLRIHSGDKPYKCEHCGKTFNQSSNLQTHLRIHSGGKPYKCEHCGKSFNQNGSLQIHLQETSHTSEDGPNTPSFRTSDTPVNFKLLCNTAFS